MSTPIFNADATRRTARFVRQGELHPPQPKKAAQAKTANITWHGRLVVTTSSIGAGGGGSLGKGTAQLQLITVDDSGNATYADAGYDDITIYNGGSSIDSGRLCQVKVADGVFMVDVDYCPAT